ncbi:MAG: DUF2188 domain-containing protein [Cyclobacteriaceae bacterium]
MTKRTHIIKRGNSWAVKTEGKSKASKVYASKEDALIGAQSMRKNGYDVVVHKSDGTVQKWQKSKK